MIPVVALLVLSVGCEQVTGESEPVAWPLFEFWNPLTWLHPRFSTETMYHILRANRESNKKIYQQLKKALLPANLFFGNIRAQFAAWDSGKEKKSKTSEERRPGRKKPRKSN